MIAIHSGIASRVVSPLLTIADVFSSVLVHQAVRGLARSGGPFFRFELRGPDSTMDKISERLNMQIGNLSNDDFCDARHVAKAKLPTPWGIFDIHGFVIADQEHLVIQYGESLDPENCLLRVHSECLTGDALFSQRCDCGAQLKAALEAIAIRGSGLVLYLRQEGRGIGLINKLRAYELQDQGLDTVDANLRLGFPADARDYRVCKPLLDFFGIRGIQLMTNNPRKVDAVANLGFEIVQRVPITVGAVEHNHAYLATKASRFGHMFN